ncbi:MAG: ATP-binding cassette domain-containing protein [Candidatus Diapherotrites archaeon]
MPLSIKKISISIGKKELFLDESVGIADGSKVGLIGRNGVGKTTFLKAILGQADYTGEIEFTGKAAYFSQHVDLDPHKTVRQIIEESATTHNPNQFEKESHAIEKKLSDQATYQNNNAQLTKLTDRYVELQAKMAQQQTPGSTKIKSILRTFEVQEAWLDQTIGSLSTGQRAVIAIVRVLSSDADLLLLDEPTNHLDFKRLDILENYVRDFKGTVIIVTHDRYFLDRVCDTIIKIGLFCIFRTSSMSL